MKRVSFKVAKALKEAGYPQEYEAFYSNDGELHVNMSYEYKTYMYKNQIGYSAPTYLDVWLWLWREKKIYINVILAYLTDFHYVVYRNDYEWIKIVEPNKNRYSTPEEAIVASVNYLVENDLIK